MTTAASVARVIAPCSFIVDIHFIRSLASAWNSFLRSFVPSSALAKSG